nr:putative nuclease HARBI1 [Lytechinus pictus]
MDLLDQITLLQIAVLQQELLERDVEDARRRKRRRRPRRYQTRPWLTEERRRLYGHFSRLMEELRVEDPQPFSNYLRMEPAMFEELVQRVGPRIVKHDTRMRKALPPGLKLAITVRFLASGDKYPSLMYSFRVARNTISLIIPEVCQAIVEEYKDEVITCPITPEEWTSVEEVFRNRWNVPHAVGALDGKHVAIRKPAKSGSLYHNYKGFFSVVLMALVDGDYKLLWVDTSAYGSMSDAQIFNESELKDCLADGSIGFPEPSPLPKDDEPMSYFILGDDAFG